MPRNNNARTCKVELEDAHEQTYFEIGGLLSVMQKEKMVRPLRLARRMGGEQHCDEAEQGAGSDPDLQRDRRVRGAWAHVQDIGWTKLRAIARVLDEESAHHWISLASNHSKKEMSS